MGAGLTGGAFTRDTTGTDLSVTGKTDFRGEGFGFVISKGNVVREPEGILDKGLAQALFQGARTDTYKVALYSR